VVVWHDSYGGRQAGVLVTGPGGDREIQPVSISIPPAWVLTFNDPESR